jgi:hypothetical protein
VNVPVPVQMIFVDLYLYHCVNKWIIDFEKWVWFFFDW